MLRASARYRIGRWFAGAVALLGLSIARAQAEDAAPAPWWVASSVEIDRAAMTIVNGNTRLAGTLYYPRGARHLPTVIAFHAASEPSQDAPLYRHLKQMLPPLGVAVFVFDRRATGASTGGDALKTDFDALVGDGLAVFRTLAADARVDSARIGFWGLSQGGWLTLLAAAREPRAAFAVAVSAPIATADVQMNFAAANILRIHGYQQGDIDEAIAARTAVDDYARGKRDRASAQAAVDAARTKPWWRLIYLAGNIDDPTWPAQIASDPLRSLERSKVPTLLIFGQADPWVPVGHSLAILSRTATRHPQVTLAVIDRADHLMMVGVDPKRQIDPAAFAELAPDAPAYFARMAAWIAERGLAGVTAALGQASPKRSRSGSR